jgi:hypothetical protein
MSDANVRLTEASSERRGAFETSGLLKIPAGEHDSHRLQVLLPRQLVGIEHSENIENPGAIRTRRNH